MRLVALLQCRTVKKISLNKVLLVIIISSACSASTITQHYTPASPAAQSARSGQNNLDQSFVRIAAKAQGRVGFAARVLETGEEAGLNSSEHYPMHSVYKLPISMAVLRRVDAGELKLDQMVEIKQSDFVRQGMYSPIRDQNPNGARLALVEILRYAVAESDGTASDVLMKLAGGPQAVMAFLNEIKVSGSMWSTRKTRSGAIGRRSMRTGRRRVARSSYLRRCKHGEACRQTARSSC